MGSIGDKLRAAREAKRLSVRDVVKDTNISPLYVQALEDEDFDKFPGETYIIGFLRSYAEYLKLDSEDMIQSYKGYKIGESATPLEELTRPTSTSFLMLAGTIFEKNRKVALISVAVIAALLLFLGIRMIFSSRVDTSDDSNIKSIKEQFNAKSAGADIENIRALQLTNEKGIVLVYKNEAVQFLVENKEVVFTLKNLKQNSIDIEILSMKKVESLEMESPKTIHIEGVPRDIVMTLKGVTENRAKVMVALAKKGDGKDEAVKEEDKKASADNTKVEATNKRNLKIVFEVEFVEKSYIELYLDGSQKKRGFVPKGTRERWEAAESIQVRIGNAGGIRAKINDKEYTFGGLGQVANKVITWKKDLSNPNIYNIVIKDW